MPSRPVRWTMWAALLALLMTGAADPCKRKKSPSTADTKDSAPVAKRTVPAKKNPLAGCQLCHVDIEDEYVKSLHFREKVACTECHGPSKGHVADENNEVKPDEVFARKHVDRLCSECHDCSRKMPEWSALPLDKRKVCSECHVAHEFALATADK